jgi:two-component system, OmpR family, sensor kinase
MLESVRVRLTLWYAGVLAVVLVALALATYFILRQSTAQRADSNLAELADAFLTTLHAEIKDEAGPERLRRASLEAIAEHRFRDHIYAVLDPTGALVVSSRDLPAAIPTPSQEESFRIVDSDSFRALVESSSRADRVLQNVKGEKGGYRGYVRHFVENGQTFTLVVLQSLHSQQEMFEEVAQTFSLVIPIAVLLASAGGYFLAYKSLAPVVAMSTQAGRIGAATLHERLPVKNEKDELGHLARSFNQLLDRLDQSFDRQRRFMADASHELRTPVAILRGEAEVALSRPDRKPEEYRESLAVLRAESQRLTHIVEDLFTLARADAGQYPLSPHDFYLDELVADCTRTTRTLALAKRITLNCDAAEELPIHADEALLRRMILNLLDNAFKYTPEGGSVSVACRPDGGEYALSIMDTGTGIPVELQPRIFERFFRADKARSRAESDGGGAGLGLSIARWIAEAHHGRLELARSDASGSTFTAYLPANSPVSAPAAR